MNKIIVVCVIVLLALQATDAIRMRTGFMDDVARGAASLKAKAVDLGNKIKDTVSKSEIVKTIKEGIDNLKAAGDSGKVALDALKPCKDNDKIKPIIADLEKIVKNTDSTESTIKDKDKAKAKNEKDTAQTKTDSTAKADAPKTSTSTSTSFLQDNDNTVKSTNDDKTKKADAADSSKSTTDAADSCDVKKAAKNAIAALKKSVKDSSAATTDLLKSQDKKPKVAEPPTSAAPPAAVDKVKAKKAENTQKDEKKVEKTATEVSETTKETNKYEEVIKALEPLAQ